MAAWIENKEFERHIKMLRASMPQAGVNTFQIDNSAPHAKFVQAKEGYYVIDEDHVAATIDEVLRPMIEKKETVTQHDLEAGLEMAADREIDRMQEFTGFFKPPLLNGWPSRPAHDGAWADVTTELASSYMTKVNRRPVKIHRYYGRPNVPPDWGLPQ